MTREITKKMLKNCKIELTKNGFTIWIVEKDGQKYWLVDGSMFFEWGTISLGDYKDEYPHKAVYIKKENQIIIWKKQKNKKI